MTSQILIKQDFDNYSENFSFARRRFFLAELISTVTILESAIYYWTWTLPMMTSTSMRNNFCQEPETHTEQEGKGNLLIKLLFFFFFASYPQRIRITKSATVTKGNFLASPSSFRCRSSFLLRLQTADSISVEQ